MVTRPNKPARKAGATLKPKANGGTANDLPPAQSALIHVGKPKGKTLQRERDGKDTPKGTDGGSEAQAGTLVAGEKAKETVENAVTALTGVARAHESPIGKAENELRDLILPPREKFIAALALGLSPTGAAEMAGVARTTPYRWRETEPEFAAAWFEALERAKDVIADELRRRAAKGVEKPVFQQGKLVGYVREFSDEMLLRAAARLDPSWRPPSKVEFSGPNGGPVQIEAVRTRLADKIAAISRRA